MRAAPAVWIRRSVVLANALALVVGLVLVVVAAFLSKQQVPATVLSLIGGAFVSAAVVTLVLGALAVRETVEQVDSALLRGLQDVLDPIRDPVFASTLTAYRWDCLLACPWPGDEHPDYAYQNLRISYRVDAIPSSLQMVCAASRDDRALEEFRAENFVLRWLVDDDLDPGDPMVFRVGGIRVDNEPLKSRAGAGASSRPTRRRSTATPRSSDCRFRSSPGAPWPSWWIATQPADPAATTPACLSSGRGHRVRPWAGQPRGSPAAQGDTLLEPHQRV